MASNGSKSLSEKFGEKFVEWSTSLGFIASGWLIADLFQGNISERGIFFTGILILFVVCVFSVENRGRSEDLADQVSALQHKLDEVSRTLDQQRYK